MTYELPSHARRYLEGRIGPGAAPTDVRLEDIKLPPIRLPEHPLVSYDFETRVRHSRGESFPDLVSLRSGVIGASPDGVAFPEGESDVEELLTYARRVGAWVIPWGGGTSVVGGVNPLSDGRPSLTISLERMWGMEDLDEESMLAAFGPGVRGPWLEAQLRRWGYTLGHYPQSFEYSTLGGWVATRSSGQQSLLYGRIEDLFRGGRMVTPEGPVSLPPFPASAAGPDLRHLVLGSEGRLGLISSAVVRIRPLPEEERFWGMAFPTWEDGVEAVRAMAQGRLPLSMLRLSDPEETGSQLRLALSPYVRRLLDGLLARRGLREEKCLLILGATGSVRTVRMARSGSAAVARAAGGVTLGNVAGREWRNSRFRVPYLRNTLWGMGWAVDTLETATVWSEVIPTSRAVLGALRDALGDERVLAMSHVSHAYPTGASLYFTFFFRLAADHESTLERWRTLKSAASRAIVARGATITHQHGVGADHLPYLRKEKGELGIAMLESVARTVDPEATMNPGKLVSGPSDDF